MIDIVTAPRDIPIPSCQELGAFVGGRFFFMLRRAEFVSGIVHDVRSSREGIYVTYKKDRFVWYSFILESWTPECPEYVTKQIPFAQGRDDCFLFPFRPHSLSSPRRMVLRVPSEPCLLVVSQEGGELRLRDFGLEISPP